MHDTLQPLIHKAPVLALALHVGRTGLCIGDPAEAVLQADGSVAILIPRPRSRFSLLPQRKPRVLGQLGPAATAIVGPALGRGDHLRIRIVGLTPEHLTHDGRAEVHISVWGQLPPIPRPPTAHANAQGI